MDFENAFGKLVHLEDEELNREAEDLFKSDDSSSDSESSEQGGS